ncbi:hypothetical protein JOB18_013507 [Solea senegalensis]|nr:hypothetical protein JOB18_013507 [Solea senegalensis]
MVVGESPEDEELLQPLAEAVQRPLRKLFSALTWDDTLAKIHDLGNPKTKTKHDEAPMFHEVTESAKLLLDAEEEIPCDLMAKLLKFQLLHIKANDQQRRLAEQAEDEDVNLPPATKASDKKRKTPPLQSSKKTKLKRRDEAEPPNFKADEPDDGPEHYILLLGFHQPHLIRILDAIGVHVTNVIKLCSEHEQTCEVQQEQHASEDNKQSSNQSTSAVTSADSSSERQAAPARTLELFWSGLRPVLLSAPLESELHNLAQLCYTVPEIRPPSNSNDPDCPCVQLELGSRIFDGIAKLIYDGVDWRQQHQHFLDSINLIHIPSVAVLDIQPSEGVSTRLSVTLNSKRTAVQDVDMRYYSYLLNLVPPEACSVPLILDCMLQQVVISTERSDQAQSRIAWRTKSHSGPWLDPQLAAFMLQNFLPLVHTNDQRSRMLNSLVSVVQREEDKKGLVDRFGAEETQRNADLPLVIRHHDERALRLRDVSAVQGFDPTQVESSIMKLSPVWEMIQSAAHPRKSLSTWMSIKQHLQHDSKQVMAGPEVERLFHQSVFEAMTLTRLDQNGELPTAAGTLETLEPTQQKPTIIPWDNPLIYAKVQLHNAQNKAFLTEEPGNAEFSERMSCDVELSDIQRCRLRSLHDWYYAEHHSVSVFPQVLQVASEEYLCLDTFRGSLNNVLYIFCHSPTRSDHQCKEFWDVALHTDVKFRTYLENVADTILDWTREEESKRMALQLLSAESPNDENSESTDDEDSLDPFIRKDSLKAWKLEQERLKEEEEAKKSKKVKMPKGKPQKEETKSNKNLTGSRKNRPESADSSGEKLTELTTTSAPPVHKTYGQLETQEHCSGFTGYSMNGMLIHVSGCLQYLFPSDGGKITVENINYVEGSRLMKVAVKKDGHHFFTHIIRDVYPSQSLDKEADYKKENLSAYVAVKRVKLGSLSALLNNGIHLSYSFYGPTGEHIESIPETEVAITRATSDVTNSPSSSTHQSRASDTDSASLSGTQESQPQVCEGQSGSSPEPFNSLSLSLPNGLLLQFRREDTQEEQGILVRQSFPLHGTIEVKRLQDTVLTKELSRNVTSQGTVIRYMRDKSAEMLFADGAVSFSQDGAPTEEDNTNEEQNIESNWKRCWITTYTSGSRVCTVGSIHKRIRAPRLLTYKVVDPITHEVMLSREDMVVTVHNKDGSLSVEHADGTRITTFHQERTSNTEEQCESVIFKATSESDCVPITHCADSIDENRNIQEACDSGNKQSWDSAETVGGKEDAGSNSSACEDVFNAPCKDGDESASKGSVSTKERVVLVEKEGYATVVMYPERHMAHVFLADGTVITGDNQGVYQVFPSSVGFLQIQSDGKCVYSTDTLVNPSLQDDSPINQPGIYTMSHTDSVACDVTDPDGNHFQVMEDGQISVLNVSAAPSTEKQYDEDDNQEKEVVEDKEVASRLPVKHCSRLFLVHEDGSGTELLSSQVVEELLYQAYSDPTIAVLREPLPDTQDEFGITILKPLRQSIWSQWLLEKQNPDITPPNLRNRTWHDFPDVEKKNPGPVFGTNLGRGLNVGERPWESAAQLQSVRGCPKVLEMRELHQHRPFTKRLKKTIDTRLKEYIESLMERERRSEEIKVKDPRTREESDHAADLLSLVLSFAEEEDINLSCDKKTPADIGSLYGQGLEAKADHSDSSGNIATLISDSFWTQRHAQYRQELCEEKACREALRRRSVVPYFHTENIPLHQTLSADIHTISKSDSAEAESFVKDAPHENTPRPLNPTPSQSASHGAGSDRRQPDKRPINPTPQSDGESSLRILSRPYKSVQVDVTGKPRKSKVRLPASILCSKPCSVPNKQFLSVEEPVRRKCRMISLMDPKVVMRGFQLFPSSVDFGTVQEGTNSTIIVLMRNVGVDTCRFHVKQPRAATGLRVIYNPGPVPAGLYVELQVQLFAMCSAETGEEVPKKHISHDIVIHTETDIIYLPVTALIVPERLYDIWLKDHSGTNKKKSSRILELPSASSATRGGAGQKKGKLQ